ncbi:3-hydroxyacyl-ACP dehydratase FabZ family protein [Acidipropionibacterium virtanenii]|uniref:3-hydroxyacyl-[acyl-carrier-protein] dehydratase FabZ n=1 Tax=Acidipropionibacterium virtanenii TaxID=2057246 RepID=A0A344UQ70_9ACTN|nr:beta-hydroxyacyl-ACP dehydratase [Acidipropionibacterium virtanenii]AXE37418.1 3-hydroxyacyl-[acyl-carrier-protein] dehydratase FabZ [Acidipropionibacterium virtanenii]
MTPPSPVCYSADEIRRLLPHRHPFSLLDRVEEVIAGRSGTGIKNITISDPVFSGHFPDRAIYPGVLLIEIAGQTAGIVQQAPAPDGHARAGGDVRADAADGPGPAAMMGVLGRVKRFTFHHPVVPGDVLACHVACRTVFGDMFEYGARLTVGSRLVAEGTVAVVMQPGESA